MNERLTKVLGYWQPLEINLEDYSEVNHDKLKKNFRNNLAILGLDVTIQSSHSPEDIIKWYKDLANWHQDENGIDKSFIVWSNIQSTDVKFPDNSMLEVIDGAIILINNLECLHRTPTPVNPKRWLIRTDYLNV